MSVILGLDIGSNSVGSAWVDTDKQEIHLGVSVFPAGVDEQENKRGAPKNQARREKRSQRRNLARRSARKRHLRSLLTQAGLLPRDPESLKKLFEANSWHLRRKALSERLTPHQFGRVLVHLNQRRGAVGIETDPEDPDEGKVKEGIDRLDSLMRERNATTVGELFANLMDERRMKGTHADSKDVSRGVRSRRRRRKQDADLASSEFWVQGAIRNRQYRMDEKDQLYADRRRVRDEFLKIWERQKTLGGPLAAMLTDDLRKQLDDPRTDDVWRHKGILFGQRRTYWDTGTLGRCDLEPTERCVPVADMFAQEFRVVETVNNIRITKRGEPERALAREEREKVIAALRRQKTGSVATIRKALGIDKKTVKDFFTLNIERDKDREINTDWFYREIVHGVFTEDCWTTISTAKRESVSRALLKFDPDNEEHERKLRNGAVQWWGLDDEAVDRFITAWKHRPKLENRLNLSRRAIRNLLPYMNVFDEGAGRWPTQIEARLRFASDSDAVDSATGRAATPEQHQRYALGTKRLTKADRQFLRKHKEPLPPAPMLANPVVRKAIHEVRRHLIAYWRKFGRVPDRTVIEYVRSATQPEKVRNAALALNRKREGVRKQIIEQFDLQSLSKTQQGRAIERVLLCRQQKWKCPYCGDDRPIPERIAAEGQVVETDHIIPLSRSQNNGLNNKVLCHRTCNRGKSNLTPKEWLGEVSPEFRRLEHRLQHLEKGESPDNYFTSRDCDRKWENLHRDAPSTSEFLASQFTDTAYAAKQVGQWLREVLYNGERDGNRHVFTTKGSYTSILRNDWGLSESELDRQWHDITEPGEGDGDKESRRARKQKSKDRSDHCHHAIDAVCIAFAPDRIQELAQIAEEQEKARARLGYWPRRKGVRPPWATTDVFHDQVLSVARQLVVSHRPVKRRLAGRFHEDTAYGPVLLPLPRHRREDAATLFTNRIQIDALTPNHLRVPEGWDQLSARLDDRSVPGSEKNAIRRQLNALLDPPPSKSGIVRDRALRDRLRKCLRQGGLDPDEFSKEESKKLIQEGGLAMASGVPIKSVVLLRTNSDPVTIPRKEWDPISDRTLLDEDPRTKRVYIGGNNHHIEIRERARERKGEIVREWGGKVITTFEVARRNTQRLNALRGAGVPSGGEWRSLSKEARRRFKSVISDINRRFPLVDRTDTDEGQFVMSLAEGEALHMRHPKTNEPGYFVVFKLDKPSTVHLIHHWDARRSQPRKDDEGNAIAHSQRESIPLPVSKMRDLGIEPGKPPVKVRVSPLGDVMPLIHD